MTDLPDYERGYRCPWCARWHVVPGLLVDHLERCEVRPGATHAA